jgi:hypothetical protein
MHKFTLTTTGRALEFLDEYLETASTTAGLSEPFRKYTQAPPADKLVTIYVTDFPELVRLNGMSQPVESMESVHQAVTNYLAGRLGLEPLGTGLGLEVYGQNLHEADYPGDKTQRTICSVYDLVDGPVMRLGRGDGYHDIFSPNQVIRGDRSMILYTWKGTRDRLFPNHLMAKV